MSLVGIPLAMSLIQLAPGLGQLSLLLLQTLADCGQLLASRLQILLQQAVGGLNVSQQSLETFELLFLLRKDVPFHLESFGLFHVEGFLLLAECHSTPFVESFHLIQSGRHLLPLAQDALAFLFRFQDFQRQLLILFVQQLRQIGLETLQANQTIQII